MDRKGNQEQEGRCLLHSPLCFALLWWNCSPYDFSQAVLDITVSTIDHSRSDGQQIRQCLLPIFGSKSFPKLYIWFYSSPQGFTQVSLVLWINTSQNEDTDNKIRKGKSLFSKNCCELHKLGSSMILLDTLPNYGSLLLSLLILLMQSRGHSPPSC